MLSHWFAKTYMRAGVASGARSVVQDVTVTESATSPGKERNDVRRRAAGGAAEKHQADSQIRRELKEKAERIGRERHDRVLGDDADKHVARAAEDFPEVGCREGEPHAEHHNAEQNRNVRADELENLRENEPEYSKRNHPQGKRLVYELAHFH